MGPPAWLPRAVLAAGVLLGACLAAAPARAAADGAEGHRPLFVRAFADAGAGVGLRFNNPFRLPTVLGSDAESVSRTAPYSSLGAGVLLGDPLGFQHGALVRWDVALTGVRQHVVTPSYVFARRGVRFGGHARFGIPLVLGPETTAGVELGAAGTFYLLAGVGVRLEVIGTYVGGAAVEERKRAFYPVLSGQLGVVYEWERL